MEPTAILAYGINLGGANSWLIQEADEFGGMPEQHADWYDEDDNSDVIDSAETKLGEDSAVKFVRHGYSEEPDVLLVAYALERDWDGIEEPDLKWLAKAPHANGWDALLAEACRKLEITPLRGPRWILTPYGNE